MSPSIVIATLTYNDALTAPKDQYIFAPDVGSWEPVKVVFVPDSDGAVTADNSNWRKLTGTIGSTTIFQYTTDADGTPAGASWVAGTAATQGTVLVGGQLVTPTVALKIASLAAGTGAVCKGTITVTLEKRHA